MCIPELKACGKVTLSDTFPIPDQWSYNDPDEKFPLMNASSDPVA